jgi:hypothetical protein
METRTPPKLTPGSGLAASKQARADYFANLPRRDRSPKVIEKTVEVPVEVERIVYVDREVEVERIVHVEVEKIVEVPIEAEPQIPDFLRYDPLSEFLANEAKPGETDEATLDRLRAEIADLFALQRGDRLSETEADRLRYLTSHIKAMGE